MATMLLTDEEYAFVKQLMTDMRARIPQSSPRAATHFSGIAHHCAKFLAREDGKRAQRQTQLSEREQLEQAKQARRAQVQASRAQAQPQTPPPAAPRPGRATSASA